MFELLQKHSLKSVELGFLGRAEVVKIRVVDYVQSAGKLLGVFVVTLGLFTKLQESFLDLNVGKGVDAAQLVNANLGKVMLTRNMSESVDDPGSLMVTPVGKGTSSSRVLCALLRQQLQIRLVDETEDMLSPSDKILPSSDIVPNVGQAVTPRAQKQLKLTRLDVEVRLVGVGKTLADNTGIVKLDQLLEVLEKRNMGVGQALR